MNMFLIFVSGDASVSINFSNSDRFRHNFFFNFDLFCKFECEKPRFVVLNAIAVVAGVFTCFGNFSTVF